MIRTLLAATALLALSGSAFASNQLSEPVGSVQINSGKGFSPVVAGTPLNAGDRILVGKDSTVTIATATGCTMPLGTGLVTISDTFLKSCESIAIDTNKLGAQPGVKRVSNLPKQPANPRADKFNAQVTAARCTELGGLVRDGMCRIRGQGDLPVEANAPGSILGGNSAGWLIGIPIVIAAVATVAVGSQSSGKKLSP